MSHHEEDFKETTSAINVAMILLAFAGTGLLPMLLHWTSLLS
ncbi:hypothetical protein [Colwellia ponticola]|nr:hypothetical protein [Colwellia ponticola]